MNNEATNHAVHATRRREDAHRADAAHRRRAFKRTRIHGWLAAAVLACVTTCGVWAEPPSDGKNDDEAAQKKVGRRLIRQTTTGSDDDVMEKIILLMKQTTRQLEVEFDAGERTQAMQQDIMKQLDDAIKLAASQTRKSQGQQSPSKGDQRSRQDRKPSGDDHKSKPQQDGAAERRAGGTGAEDQGSATSGAADGKDLAESRRGWGNLPERERDEVIQGADERYLERYRQWIEQYYRALQDASE